MGYWYFVSLAAFGFSMLMLMLFLGLWTYNDAKVKSDHSPALWVVVVVLLSSNFLGIVLYLLLGRTKKDVPAPGTFKKALITFAILAGITFVVFMGSFLRFAFTGEGGGFSSRSGSFVRMSSSQHNGQWQISAGRANGFIRITPRLDENDLANLRASRFSGEGEVFLRLEQNGRAEEINIVTYSGLIDTSGFSPGRIRMTLFFEHARDVQLTVSWR